MSVEIFSSVSPDELQRALENELFRGILDTMPNGVQVLKALRNKKNEIIDFTYVFVNAAAENFAGKKITGKKLSSLFTDENKHPFFEKLVQVVNTGAPEDFVHHFEDGVQKWFHYAINKFGDGVLITQEDTTEREEAKGEAEKKEEQFHSVVENTPDVITRWNRDLQLIYANSAFETKTGVSNKSLYGKTNIEMGQHDDIAIPYMNSLRKAFETGQTVAHFNSFPTPAGEVYFYSRIVPEKNAKGEVETVLSIARDITDIKRAEHQLQKEHSRLKEAQEVGHIGSFEWDAVTDTIYWSEEMYRIHGIEPYSEQITLERVFSFLHPGDIPDLKESILKLRKEEDSFDIVHRIITSGGDLRYIRRIARSFTAADGKVTHLSGTVQDITQQKKAEQEIKKQSHFVSQITETVPDMISVMEFPSRKFRYINNETFVAQGFDPGIMAKLSKEELSEIIHEDDREALENYFNSFSTANDDEIVTAEYRAKNFCGNWLWFKVRGVVFQRDDSGRVTHILNIIQNITEQKNAEEKITGLNRELFAKNRELDSLNSELKTFNAVAATDYKETLRTLYTNLEYIITKDAWNLSDMGKANLRRAQTAIQKMKLLTDDIVAFSGIKALEQDISEVDLNEVLQTVLNDMSNKIEESEAKIKSDTLPAAEGYPLLLSLLFYHLLDNAIKFRKQDTKALIQIKHSASNVVDLDHADAPDILYNVISVVDNGIGFEQKQSEKIFTMFYRLLERNKYKGSGIGLAICKKIMSLHDGFITAESDPGKGSTFHCFFPIKNR